jgi:hypothetical protein
MGKTREARALPSHGPARGGGADGATRQRWGEGGEATGVSPREGGGWAGRGAGRG